MIDVIGGHTQAALGSLIQFMPHIKSGKVKALGTGGAKRSVSLPDVPTIAEAGVAGYEANNWWGVLAPAGTPRLIIDRLSHGDLGYLELAGNTETVRRPRRGSGQNDPPPSSAPI